MKLTKGRTILASLALVLISIGLIRYLGDREARRLRAVAENYGAIRSAVCILRQPEDIPVLLKSLPVLEKNRVLVLITETNPEEVPTELTRIVITLPEKHYWDSFVVLGNRKGKSVLVRAATVPRRKGSAASKILAKSLGWKTRKCRLVFESGDIVVGRERVYVTEKTIRRNAKSVKKDFEKTALLFERSLGKPVHIVRGLPDSAPRIRELLAEIDERTLIVADPAWGVRLVGEGHGAGELGESGAVKGAASLSGEMLRSAVEESEKLRPTLERIVDDLKKEGFVVHRVPAVFRHDSSDSRLSYTAVLMETMGDRRIVYLPQYGCKDSDEAAREVWQASGYVVVPIEGFPVSGPLLTDCIQVLQRQ